MLALHCAVAEGYRQTKERSAKSQPPLWEILGDEFRIFSQDREPSPVIVPCPTGKIGFEIQLPDFFIDFITLETPAVISVPIIEKTIGNNEKNNIE